MRTKKTGCAGNEHLFLFHSFRVVNLFNCSSSNAFIVEAQLTHRF
jgi:hypothetical protein